MSRASVNCLPSAAIERRCQDAVKLIEADNLSADDEGRSSMMEVMHFYYGDLDMLVSRADVAHSMLEGAGLLRPGGERVTSRQTTFGWLVWPRLG